MTSGKKYLKHFDDFRQKILKHSDDFMAKNIKTF